MKNKNIEATLLLLLGTIFWGMTFVFIKEGVEKINVYLFLSYRFLLSALILFFIFYKKFHNLNYKTIIDGTILFIPLAAGYITQTIGLTYTEASKAGFITGLAVVFVPIFLAIYKKTLPKLNHIISVLSAFIGLALLTLNSKLNINIGDIWVFLCAIAFGLYIIFVNILSQDNDAILLTFVQLFLTGLLTLIISFFTTNIFIPKDFTIWKGIIFTAVFATAFMLTIQNHYQKYISEVKASIIYSFEPLFAFITAHFYLGEKITFKIILGGLLIFFGMIISEDKIFNYKKHNNINFNLFSKIEEK